MIDQSRIAARLPFFYGWAVLYAAGSSMLVRNAAASLTLSIFVVPMSDELGWSRTLIVGAVSAAGIASIFIAPATGWLVDRIGPRVLLGVAVLVLGSSTMSLRWAATPIAFYLAYGAGRLVFNSFVQIGATTVVSQWFVAKRGRATAILFVAHSVGMGGFPFLAQMLINGTGDWRMAWFWLAFVVWGVALLPIWLLIVRKPEDIGEVPDGLDYRDSQSEITSESGSDSDARLDAEESAWTMREAMRTPTLWLLAVAGGMVFFVHAGVTIHQAAFLHDRGISATGAATAIVVLAAGTAVGSLMWGVLMDRIPGRFVYVIVALWLGGVSMLFLTVNQIGAALVVAGLFGVGLGGLLVVPPVVTADYFGRASLGSIRGVLEPFVGIGQAAGALGAGIIFDVTDSYVAAFPTFTAMAALAAAVLIFMRPPRRGAAQADSIAETGQAD
ncbi:MAG: MFS transporter [Chloroflexi bacterium]|nr:MFS transporter [Chloroflexota bacterium]